MYKLFAVFLISVILTGCYGTVGYGPGFNYIGPDYSGSGYWYYQYGVRHWHPGRYIKPVPTYPHHFERYDHDHSHGHRR